MVSPSPIKPQIRLEKRGKTQWAVLSGDVEVEVFASWSKADAMVGRLRRDAACQKRKCLCCKAPFLSWGPGNRLCDLCKKKDSFNGTV